MNGILRIIGLVFLVMLLGVLGFLIDASVFTVVVYILDLALILKLQSWQIIFIGCALAMLARLLDNN